MRKIKLELKCRVPSWNYCNYDGFTDNGRFSKDLCRFCVKTKTGHRCVLYDVPLAASEFFVQKPKACIDATAGFAVSVDEDPPVPTIDPKTLMRETLVLYDKTRQQLLAQGYPGTIADRAAKKHVLGDK